MPDVLLFFDALSPVPEQVIEVPKILPMDVLMRTMVREPQSAEQLVEVPTQIVDNPVPRRSFSGDLRGFPPGQSSSKRTANKIADIPSGRLQDFPQTLHRAGVSSDLPDEASQGVLSTFPRKNAKIPRTQGSELSAQSSSWTP